uniref:Uncharacterized protein n=1 Tax=Solanum lycopersicum TaxID=4081 RepID=A0A3Q7IZW3_SOLLC
MKQWTLYIDITTAYVRKLLAPKRIGKGTPPVMKHGDFGYQFAMISVSSQ